MSPIRSRHAGGLNGWMRSCGPPSVGRSTLAELSQQRCFSGSGGHRFAKGWAGCWVLLPRACDPGIDVVVLQRSRDGNAVAPVDDVVAVGLSA